MRAPIPGLIRSGRTHTIKYAYFIVHVIHTRSDLQGVTYVKFVQDHYLPHIIRAKLKLACSGVDDSKFTDFLNNSLKEAERKELLESRYCTELALYSIIRGDLDRAKYYNDNSLQLFLQVRTIDSLSLYVCLWLYSRTGPTWMSFW